MAGQVEPTVNIGDILIKKYGFLREEIMFYIAGTKSHIRYFQVFIGGSLVIIWYFFGALGSNSFVSSLQAYGLSKDKLLFLIMLSLTIVSFYFIFDLLEIFFTTALLSARLAMIEEHINKLARYRVLEWESTIARGFWTTKSTKHRARPRLILAGFQYLIVSGFSVLMPIYFYVRLWNDASAAFRRILIITIALTITWSLLAIYMAHFIRNRARPEALEFMRRLTSHDRLIASS
jgi:hypothetical protein